ncbi:MAG: protein-glutamate O-methyltransferase CheR, partial [Bacteroidales bacterium]|nr:protein-glutamate O-methyltransferase CheR [Bacteroidales bacterium]
MGTGRLNKILSHLKEQRGFDFSGYRLSMLERRIQKRVYSINSKGLDDYYEYLKNHSEELEHLFDVLTINVSSFFRNCLAFELVSKMIIPEIFSTKIKENFNSLRIWSAGCSFGEEPYSMAILISELLEQEESTIQPTIFATDIDKKALKRASLGSYDVNSISEVKYGLLNKYFTKDGDNYKIDSQIKNKVQFSFYDLLDKNRLVPPDSIFGGFDIVLCRNVLIYFEPEFQNIIFNKLYKSLNKNGILILGEAEVP